MTSDWCIITLTRYHGLFNPYYCASQWQDFPIYTQIHAFLGDMEVVNDVTEHAVKDVCEYAHMTRAAGDRDNVVLVALDDQT